MLDDSKENAGAEKDMLDVLWSYCMMERAAGWVAFCVSLPIFDAFRPKYLVCSFSVAAHGSSVAFCVGMKASCAVRVEHCVKDHPRVRSL